MRVLLVFLTLLLLMPGQLMAEARQYGSVQAVVVRVCDGDTVVVDIPEYPDIIGKAIRIRLAGVDAEELHDPDPERQRNGILAWQAMAALLPPGAVVTLQNIRRDKYFRLDADIWHEGRNVAEVIGLPAYGRNRRPAD